MHNQNDIQSLSIIGSGNVSWHLARAFYNAGLEICHVISRNSITSKELAGLVDAEALSTASEMESLPDLIIICVPDDAIQAVSMDFGGFDLPVVHTSGSTGIEELSANNKRGVLYPLQTFSKNKDMEYENIPVFIESNDPKFEEVLLALAKRISGDVRKADSIARRKLHMSAVYACNFSNHMVHIASKLLKDEGMELALLGPLMEETCKKLISMNPGDAQTGPASRGDMLTIEKHLEVLDSASNEYKIYKLLSDNILAYKQDE